MARIRTRYVALKKTADGYPIAHATCKEAEQKGEEKLWVTIPTKNLKTEVKYNHQTRLEPTEAYLRINVDESAVCWFSYSADGKEFHPIGEPFQARQGKWIGAKMGLFILNATQGSPRSWIDVDWFRVQPWSSCSLILNPVLAVQY